MNADYRYSPWAWAVAAERSQARFDRRRRPIPPLRHRAQRRVPGRGRVGGVCVVARVTGQANGGAKLYNGGFALTRGS